MKTIIHVNQHVIKSNSKNNECLPVLTCKTYKDNNYASEVEILSEDGAVIGKFIYRPEKPLSCGAKVWFETNSKIKIVK